MKILVVDDEPLILTLIEDYLTGYCNYQVTTAKDGEEAWNLFTDASNHYDLIITDINLPKLDGLSVVKRINEISNVPIICITGHSDLEANAKNSDLNIITVLTKPFELEDLRRIIYNIKNKKASN
jgi:DNA-binding response OmpR family regulator